MFIFFSSVVFTKNMKNIKIALTFLLICLLFSFGCSPGSLDDYQKEGESVCRTLTNELKDIETRDDLVKALPKLKKRFHHLVDVVIEARTFQEGHPEEKNDLSFDSHQASEALKSELKRIYQIEGGRELVENAQREALIRLDTFEKELKNQKQSRRSTKKSY
jgi:hypothetical protein